MDQAFYASKPWRTLRRRILLRDQWSCQMCGELLREGRSYPASAVVDHIQPRQLSPALALDPDNLQAVCKSCHDGPIQRIEAQCGEDASLMLEAKQNLRRRRAGKALVTHDETGLPLSDNHPWRKI